MAQYDIGIDLGTTTIIIAMEGKGVILNQPSVVAVDTRKDQVLAVGDDALAMVGRTPNYILATRPLQDGVISNHTLTKELICRFVNKVYDSKLIKPRVAVCVPAAITGSGTTDIAVISMGGKVRSASVKIAGNTFDDEIQKYARLKFNVAIGLRTAEELKKQVACCRPCAFSSEMEVKGRSLLTGLPQRLTVTTEDLYEAVMPLAEQIAAAAHQVLEHTPPELAGDIYSAGVVLTGGGSKLKGLDEYLSQQLKVKVRVSEDPINCVALGTARCLEIGDQLESGFVDATPRLGHR